MRRTLSSWCNPRPSLRAALAVGAFGAILLGSAAPALALGETAVVPGRRLFTELDADSRVDIAIHGVAGQALSLLLKPWVRSALIADVTIEGPDGEPLDLASVLTTKLLKNRRRGDRTIVRVRGLRLPASGTYRIAIASMDGTSGGFDLTNTARPPRPARGRGEIVSAGVPAEVRFGAAPQDTVTLITRGLGRPRWKPIVERLVEASAALLELGDTARSGPHTIQSAGEHRFEVGRGDGETGGFAYTVKLRRPRVSREPTDIADLQATGTVTGRILVNGDRGRPEDSPAKAAAAQPHTALPPVADSPSPDEALLPPAIPVETPSVAAEFAVGEFLVYAPASAGGSTLAEILHDELPGAALEIARSVGPSGPHLVRIPHLADRLPTPRDLARTRTILDAVRGAPGLGWCEPNYVLRSTADVNDPYVPYQLGLAAVRAQRAWDIQPDAAAIVVAVVDTGSFSGHPELESVYVAGRDFVRGFSDDGDGWDANPEDASHSFHGTAVAGVIGARTNNGTGMASVCRDVRILPVRVLGRYGGTSFDVAMGIRWAAGLPVMELPVNPLPARVINLSLGGPGYSQVLADAVTDATSAGSLVVVAAGNAASQTRQYPAANDGAMAITAVDRNLRVTCYSTYGSWVSMTAPGGDPAYTGRGIITTYFDPATLDPIYVDVAGTSFACPFVAGVAALVI